MKHMSHPSNPDHVVEATDDRATVLRTAGWAFVKPGPAPKGEKPAS